MSQRLVLLLQEITMAANYPVSNNLTNCSKLRCQSGNVCLTGHRHCVNVACLVLQYPSDVKHCNLVAQYSLVCTCRHMRQILVCRQLGWKLSVFSASMQQGDDRVLKLVRLGVVSLYMCDICVCDAGCQLRLRPQVSK